MLKSKIDKALMFGMLKQGWKKSAIAKHFGVTYGWVVNMINRMPPEEAAKLLEAATVDGLPPRPHAVFKPFKIRIPDYRSRVNNSIRNKGVRGVSVDKKELAAMKVYKDLGYSSNKISNLMGLSPSTINDYLVRKTEAFNDPIVKALISRVRENEIDELFLIGKKARAVLDNYLDDVIEGKKEVNPISVTAIMDRSFQQRRILESKSTENISILHVIKTIDMVNAGIDEKEIDGEAVDTLKKAYDYRRFNNGVEKEAEKNRGGETEKEIEGEV